MALRWVELECWKCGSPNNVLYMKCKFSERVKLRYTNYLNICPSCGDFTSQISDCEVCAVSVRSCAQLVVVEPKIRQRKARTPHLILTSG